MKKLWPLLCRPRHYRPHLCRGKILAAVLILLSSTTLAAESQDVAALVKQLGSAEFRQREGASQQLVELGQEAVAELSKHAKSTDPEIRLRCERILAVIARRERWKQVDDFANDVDGSKGTTLPGWERFQEVTGGDAAARSVFVSMYRIDQEMMSAAEDEPDQANAMLVERAALLQRSQNIITVADAVAMTSVLLFVAGNEELEIQNATLDSQLYSACLQSKFATAVNGGDNQDVYRALMGHWVAESTGYRQIKLALRYDLPQGVEAGRKLLDRGNAISSLYRQYAILAIAKTGSKEDSVHLESVLDEELVVGSQTVNGQRYSVKLRDVALAGIIHMHGEDPKEFGFDRLALSSSYLFSRSSLGFVSDEAREAALAKWRAHIEPQPPEPEIPPPPQPEYQASEEAVQNEQVQKLPPLPQQQAPRLQLKLQPFLPRR